MNAAAYYQMTRWRRTAQTWIGKASWRLQAGAHDENAAVRAVVGYEASMLVNAMLYECDTLLPLVGDDEIEEVERAAQVLVSALRARRLAEKLGQVEGRTPEEAAAFVAAAGRLRREG